MERRESERLMRGARGIALVPDLTTEEERTLMQIEVVAAGSLLMAQYGVNAAIEEMVGQQAEADAGGWPQADPGAEQQGSGWDEAEPEAAWPEEEPQRAEHAEQQEAQEGVAESKGEVEADEEPRQGGGGAVAHGRQAARGLLWAAEAPAAQVGEREAGGAPMGEPGFTPVAAMAAMGGYYGVCPGRGGQHQPQAGGCPHHQWNNDMGCYHGYLRGTSHEHSHRVDESETGAKAATTKHDTNAKTRARRDYDGATALAKSLSALGRALGSAIGVFDDADGGRDRAAKQPTHGARAGPLSNTADTKTSLTDALNALGVANDEVETGADDADQSLETILTRDGQLHLASNEFRETNAMAIDNGNADTREGRWCKNAACRTELGRFIRRKARQLADAGVAAKNVIMGTTPASRHTTGEVICLIGEFVALMAGVLAVGLRSRRSRSSAPAANSSSSTKNKAGERKVLFTTDSTGQRKWQLYVESQARKKGIAIALLLGWIESPLEEESKLTGGT